jgi:hypothetical protein
MTRTLSVAAAVVLSLSLSMATSGWAGDYTVNVTRKGPQLYKVTGKDLYVATRSCYEYVYYEDAVLRMSGKTGTIVFLDSGGKCDVKGVYGKTDIAPGDYSISVTHETDDWYSVDGTELLIRTMTCSEYWYSEEVVLRVGPAGAYVIEDADGNQCYVEGVFSRLTF